MFELIHVFCYIAIFYVCLTRNSTYVWQENHFLLVKKRKPSNNRPFESFCVCFSRILLIWYLNFSSFRLLNIWVHCVQAANTLRCFKSCYSFLLLDAIVPFISSLSALSILIMLLYLITAKSLKHILLHIGSVCCICFSCFAFFFVVVIFDSSSHSFSV